MKSHSEKQDTPAGGHTQFVEALTSEERALLAEYPWPRTEVDRAMTKLLALHDHLQARVKELEADRERALRMAEDRFSR